MGLARLEHPYGDGTRGDAKNGCLVADYGAEVDAALLQAVTLRFLPLGDPRLHATIVIRSDLDCLDWLRRYRRDDGFGKPAVAFTPRTFWLVEALATVGWAEKARAL